MILKDTWGLTHWRFTSCDNTPLISQILLLCLVCWTFLILRHKLLSNQCLITLPEVRTRGLVLIVRHTCLRLSVNKVEGHVGLTRGQVDLQTVCKVRWRWAVTETSLRWSLSNYKWGCETKLERVGREAKLWGKVGLRRILRWSRSREGWNLIRTGSYHMLFETNHYLTMVKAKWNRNRVTPKKIKNWTSEWKTAESKKIQKGLSVRPTWPSTFLTLSRRRVWRTKELIR